MLYRKVEQLVQAVQTRLQKIAERQRTTRYPEGAFGTLQKEIDGNTQELLQAILDIAQGEEKKPFAKLTYQEVLERSRQDYLECVAELVKIDSSRLVWEGDLLVYTTRSGVPFKFAPALPEFDASILQSIIVR